MARRESYNERELTRHMAMPQKYHGYTAMDWFKFYGLIAGLLFFLALSWSRYFELFEDIEGRANQPFDRILAQIMSAEEVVFLPNLTWGGFVGVFAGGAFLLVAIAVLGFLWWAAGALVSYSRWQLAAATFWRWFWAFILLFYTYVLFDPLDSIHPAMSIKGRAAAPNLVALLAGEWPPLSDIFAGNMHDAFFSFQWGYFILWSLFWFLLAALHWQYVADGLREVWFYSNRFNRYGASVLSGFRETALTLQREPVTRDYPRQMPQLAESFRGVPRLAVDSLSEADAARIIAADASGAIVAAPGQPAVLFVDLGRFDYSPELAKLLDESGRPLVEFSSAWPKPSTRREELVVPLKRPGGRAPQDIVINYDTTDGTGSSQAAGQLPADSERLLDSEAEAGA